MSTVERFYPGVPITGCLFHFKQCIRRKIQSLGLLVAYNKSLGIQFLIKLVFSLVYVKPEDVGHGLTEVFLAYLESQKDHEEFEEVYELLLELINYLEVTWIGKLMRGDTRAPPMYAVLLWNKYNEVLTGLPLTNNQVESHNAKWNATLAKKPTLWDVLDGFQRQEASAETILREDSLATNVVNTDRNKQRNQKHMNYQADLRKMVESYNNMPLGIYMNNIVRFFNDV